MTSEKVSILAMSERSPHVPQIRRFAVPAMAAVGMLSLASCAKDAPQDTWQPAGDNAQKIQDLQWPVFLIAGIVGVMVFAAVLYVVIRFKDRGQPIPEQSHGNALIEYTFIAIPAVLLAIIGGFTVNTMFELNRTNDTQCEINVTGQQWWWEYDYPVAADGSICDVSRTSNE